METANNNASERKDTSDTTVSIQTWHNQHTNTHTQIQGDRKDGSLIDKTPTERHDTTTKKEGL